MSDPKELAYGLRGVTFLDLPDGFRWEAVYRYRFLGWILVLLGFVVQAVCLIPFIIVTFQLEPPISENYPKPWSSMGSPIPLILMGTVILLTCFVFGNMLANAKYRLELKGRELSLDLPGIFFTRRHTRIPVSSLLSIYTSRKLYREGPSEGMRPGMGSEADEGGNLYFSSITLRLRDGDEYRFGRMLGNRQTQGSFDWLKDRLKMAMN